MTPILAIMLAASGAGQPASHTLFTCSLGKKSAQISAVGDSLVNRYGSPKRTELTITGGPRTGTKAPSGLVVMKGQTRISYQTSRNHTWFTDKYGYDALRPDTAEYSAP